MATSKRRVVREKVLQTLYAFELSKDPLEAVIINVMGDLREMPEEFEFAKNLVHQIVGHKDEIEQVIRTNVQHWEYSRIAIIDNILLRMGIGELLYFPDIPPKVTISEAIEIAKRYSTEQSGKFVNGVLDAILIGLKKSNSLHKTGRGLLDHNPSPKRAASNSKRPHEHS
jgi:transcription antitermination protein NusB